MNHEKYYISWKMKLFLLQTYMMLSFTRAFTTQRAFTRSNFVTNQLPNSFRLLSSTDGTVPDTSVVATCTEKIKEALATDNVIVTGKDGKSIIN